MARPSTLRLLRARLSAGWRTPWVLLALFAGDIVEIGASLTLAVMQPSKAAARLPYPALDVPTVAPAPTMAVAMLGVMFGVAMGAAIVAELWVMVRRTQILWWRARTRRPRLAAR